MWQVFLLHLIKDELDNEELSNKYDELEQFIVNKDIDSFNSLSNEISEIYTKFLGVKTFIHLVPIGLNKDEIWKIFELILSIPDKEEEISIDLTHGLRFHPLLMTLAMNYFKNLNTKVSIKEVYYGALELNSYFEGNTPIMKLSYLVDMIDWINAANSFTNYGDFSVLNNLLDENENSELIKRADYFTRVLQLNTVGQIKSNARNYLKQTEKTNSENNPSFKLLKPLLEEFPREIIDKKENWEIMLLVSKRQWTRSQYGLSILAAWEALMEKAGNELGKDIQNNFDDYREVSDFVRNQSGENVKWLARRLSKYRNTVAHSEKERSEQPNIIFKNFPNLLLELENILTTQEILPNYESP